jgi:Xaa-Pro aminopeptidase
MHLYGGRMASLIGACFPKSVVGPADEILTELRPRKTRFEIERIRTACQIAGEAFEEAGRSVPAGISEIDVANRARERLSGEMANHPDVRRADGFAGVCQDRIRPWQRQPMRALATAESEVVTLRWFTAIRTPMATGPTLHGLGAQVRPDARAKDIFAAVFAAREAALAAIRPGVCAASVDQAARQKMHEHGFAAEVRHATGHGVGFEAINAEARPRLHPASPDILEPGMIFNVEPAAYFEGYGGVRHCDVVVVNERGCELLFPFQCDKEDALKGA